jgi:hypothetical protein
MRRFIATAFQICHYEGPEIADIFTDANKEVGLEINAEKTKYMLLSSPEFRSKS